MAVLDKSNNGLTFLYAALRALVIISLFAVQTPTIASTSIPSGGFVAESISPVGDVDTYTFFANAGESAIIRVARTGMNPRPNFGPQLSILAPDGTLIYSENNPPAAFCNTGSFCSLDQTGEYTIFVQDSLDDAVGEYTIHFAQFPTASDPANKLPNGGTVLGEITRGDIDIWTFDAVANESAVLRAGDLSGTSVWPRVILYAPDGSVVTSNSAFFGLTCFISSTCMLTQSGTYSIVIYDEQINTDFTYSMSFAKLPGSEFEDELQPGDYSMGAHDLGDVGVFGIQVNQGDNLRIDVIDSQNNNFAPSVTLFAPDGTPFLSNSGFDRATILCFQENNCFFPESGFYSLVITDAQLTSVGSYFIEYNTSVPICAVSQDSDGDSIMDDCDNCPLVPNTSQVDSDSDGFGNVCDADFNNDCATNFLDIALFSSEFLGSNLLFDLNGDGLINFLDYSFLADSFLETPGPGLFDCLPNVERSLSDVHRE